MNRLWRKWLSRLARERRNLSASVEATLADGVSQEEQQQPGEPGGQVSSLHAVQSGILIPPVISLQSKPMPVVRVDSVVESSTKSPPAVAVNATVGQQLALTTQNTSVLRRIAQRLTSSFAAFGSSVPEEFPALPPPTADELRELSRMREGSLLPPTFDIESSLVERTNVPLANIVNDIPPSRAVVEVSRAVVEAPTSPSSGRSRQTKHPTKIRLETAPLPQVISEFMRQDTDLLQLRKENGNTSSMHLPTMESFNGEVATAARGTLSGYGVFERGQREVIIANKRITSASVVLVMLTSNPGPVVVQYVSLQPLVSFTIHLTAPVKVKTTFNYVILLGELF